MRVTIVAEPWALDGPQSWVWRLIGRFAKYHIWCVIDHFPDEDGAAILVDASSTGIQIVPVHKSVVAHEIAKNQELMVWDVNVDHPLEIKFHWLELMSCVTIVKRIVGIQSRWILTPRQLMRKLDATQAGR